MKIGIVAVVLSLLVLSVIPAFAEGFIDFYAGPSFTENTTVTISSNVASVSKNVGFERDSTFGVRGGYWFTRQRWLGVGGDFSSMHAQGDTAKFDLAPLTPMALFRLPLLCDENIPQGKLQPYIGIGPSISLYTYASADNGPPTKKINSWGINAGFQVPAGVALQLTKNVAVFSEYRYAYYRVNVLQDTTTYLFNTAIGNSDNVARKVTASLNMHNVLFGVSFRF